MTDDPRQVAYAAKRKAWVDTIMPLIAQRSKEQERAADEAKRIADEKKEGDDDAR